MFNQIILIGYLGKDPKPFTVEKNGNSGAFLSIATSEYRGTNKETIWHNVVVYDKLADLCVKNLKAGRLIQVNGSLTYRKKQAAEYSINDALIRAKEIIFLDSNKATDSQSPAQPMSNTFNPNTPPPTTGTVSKIKYDDNLPKSKSAMFGFTTAYIEHTVEELKDSSESDG